MRVDDLTDDAGVACLRVGRVVAPTSALVPEAGTGGRL